MVRLHPLQKVANAAAFELEHALRLAAAQQRERLLVVDREPVGIDLFAGRLLDQLDYLRENRQVAQPEEIHLEKAGLLDVRPSPIG